MNIYWTAIVALAAIAVTLAAVLVDISWANRHPEGCDIRWCRHTAVDEDPHVCIRHGASMRMDGER